MQGAQMNISAPFMARPVTTTLLTLAIVMAGAVGFSKLPVSPMPQIDFPNIVVNARLPGASPTVIAATVAARCAVFNRLAKDRAISHI
jgi:multidrug efflux pump